MSTPDEQLKTMIANLPEKTGHSIEQWMALLAPHEGRKHGELMKIVKGEHGVSHGFANLIVHTFRKGGVEPAASGNGEAKARGSGPDAADALVAAQYSGKEDLRPIHDAVLARVAAFGDDVEVAPKKSYASLRRRVQFALVQPSTKTRVDLGIKLKGRDPGGRLEAAGSWNSMVTHRVRLTEAGQVDDEVVGWLKDAYDAAE